MPNPMFRAHKTVDQDIPANVFTKVLFNGLDFNSGSCWDSTNSRLVLDRTGIWHINGAVYWGGEYPSYMPVDGQDIELHIIRNGDISSGIIASDIRAASGHGGQCNNICTHFWGNAGDVIEVYVFQNSGTKKLNENWSSLCWVSGNFVGDNW